MSESFTKRYVLTCLCILSLCSFLAACGGTDAQPATTADIAALTAAASAAPKLQPGEKIHLIVYGEPTLSGDYPIDPSGFLALPVVGSVKVAGMTPTELEKKLVAMFQDAHIKDPGVTVDIIEFRPFYILGEVDKPGAYPYIGGLNVMSALALAGGWT